MIIESSQNRIIKEVTSLRLKKERERLGLFVLEGERLISEIPNTWDIKYIVRAESYKGRVYSDNAYTVRDSLYNRLSDTVNPQGVMAVCSIKDYDIHSLELSPKGLYVVLENVSDPGNMGTVIRTADAAGADAVFLSRGCVDIYNTKVIRATMGSVFHLPVYRNMDMNYIMHKLGEKGISSYAAHLKGEKTPYAVDMKNGCAILIGNEANGLTDELSSGATELVKIPMVGRAESMNAAVAAGIMIYEAVRQRLQVI